ncbi:class I SAM-dependent methyltransferase [Isoptericola jiangsuensis]|uniref:class I SAM-dependent methyltransferase n=1 Tax=Isoptericola jiangsuensis TaxID=548579 RepID=UPI003AAB3D34
MTTTEEHRRAVSAEYDRRAPTYDNEMHVALADAVAAFCDVDGALERRDAVVDVATGTALALRALARRLAERGRVLQATGCDLSTGMLDVARRETAGIAALRAELVLADAADLPLPDGSADLVTCVTALHLFADSGAALREWARVLAPTGVVVTATFAAFGGPGNPHDFPTRHDDFRTPELVADAAREAGLHLTRHQHVDLPGGSLALIAELART